MKILLVGELNPYGPDDEFALYPSPRGCAGQRLAEVVMGLSRHAYLKRFSRVNLCHDKWTEAEARNSADRIMAEKWDRIVLCGQKVTRAFSAYGVDFENPPKWSNRYPRFEGQPTDPIFVVINHPSGRCRAWNDPGVVGHTRRVLEGAGVL